MSLADIREQIKAILSGVAGVGVVHDYQRWAADRQKFLDLFADKNGKINTWCITRTKTPEACDTTSHHTRRHTFRIRGYYGLKDENATELIFQNLVEDICAEFRSKYKLNDTATDTGPVQVDKVDLWSFFGVLCHFCELTLEAEEILVWS